MAMGETFFFFFFSTQAFQTTSQATDCFPDADWLLFATQWQNNSTDITHCSRCLEGSDVVITDITMLVIHHQTIRSGVTRELTQAVHHQRVEAYRC